MTSKLDTLLLELEKLDGERTPQEWEVVSDLPNYAVVSMEKTEGGQWLKRIVCATENHCHPWVDDTFGCNQQDATFIVKAVNSNKVLREVIKILMEALEKIDCGVYPCECEELECGWARQALEAAERVCEEKK